MVDILVSNFSAMIQIFNVKLKLDNFKGSLLRNVILIMFPVLLCACQRPHLLSQIDASRCDNPQSILLPLLIIDKDYPDNIQIELIGSFEQINIDQPADNNGLVEQANYYASGYYFDQDIRYFVDINQFLGRYQGIVPRDVFSSSQSLADEDGWSILELGSGFRYDTARCDGEATCEIYYVHGEISSRLKISMLPYNEKLLEKLIMSIILGTNDRMTYWENEKENSSQNRCNE